MLANTITGTCFEKRTSSVPSGRTTERQIYDSTAKTGEIGSHTPRVLDRKSKRVDVTFLTQFRFNEDGLVASTDQSSSRRG